MEGCRETLSLSSRSHGRDKEKRIGESRDSTLDQEGTTASLEEIRVEERR